jgi:hypothetical protein
MKPLTFTAVAGMATSFALAEPHVHFDISPVLQNGAIVTDGTSHLSDEDPWTGDPVDPARKYLSPNHRVFEYEFGEEPGFPLETEDPGINREPGTYYLQGGGTTTIGGTGLPLNSSLSFTVLDDLRFWTGTEFGALPNNETITITRGSNSRIVGAATGELSPLLLRTFTTDDYIHQHLLAEIGSAEPGGPTDGVYLVEAKLESSSSSVLDSQPFWLVYGYNADEDDHANAVDWVEANLVPEPSVLGLAGIGMIGLLRRVRRA